MAARFGGGWILLSRSFDPPDGRFGGVVAVTMSLDGLQAQYDGFAIGRHGSPSLMLSDGTLLVRNPGGAALVDTDLSRNRLFQSLLPISAHGAEPWPYFLPLECYLVLV